MELPFTAKLPSNFGPKSTLFIEAKSKDSGSWFSVTLFDENDMLEDKYDEPKKLGVFQLQLRYDESIVVMNSIGPGSNSGENRAQLKVGGKKDDIVRIRLKVTTNKYEVHLNNELIGTFNHRVEPVKAKYVNVYGGFKVKKLSHHKD